MPSAGWFVESKEWHKKNPTQQVQKYRKGGKRRLHTHKHTQKTSIAKFRFAMEKINKKSLMSDTSTGVYWTCLLNQAFQITLAGENFSTFLQKKIKTKHLKKNVTFVAQLKKRNASNHVNSANGGKCVGMKMCCGHLLQSGSGKQQLLFPLLDCLSHKLLNIGPVESFPASCIYLFTYFFYFFLGGGT